MSTRTHWTISDTTTISIAGPHSVFAGESVNDAPALVIYDEGNDEAFVIEGTTDSLRAMLTSALTQSYDRIPEHSQREGSCVVENCDEVRS